LSGLQHRQFRRFFTFQYATSIDADQAEAVQFAAAISHQTASFGKPTVWRDCWHRMPQRQPGQLFTPSTKETIGTDHERAGVQLVQLCKCRINLTFAACVQDMELNSEAVRRYL